jgi:3-hydroxybutyryl-CoA dehydrogenase
MKLENIETIAVIGAGTMGPGMALIFAQNGFEVKVFSRRRETLDKAKSIMRTSLNSLAEFDIVQQEAIAAILARVTFTNLLEAAASDADVICETVAESREVKSEIFAQLDKICSPETIFTSNTSSLNIFNLVPNSRLPNTLIAHWFSPPHIVPLVEVVKGPQTRDETMDLFTDLLRQMGRIPVRMEKFISGFVINRLYRALGRETFFLLDNGYITAEQLDLAAKVALAPRMMLLGLVQRYDFTGLDISAKNLQNPDFFDPPTDNKPKSLFDLVEKGYLGVKTGRGFFDYRGRTLEEILNERDTNLLRIYKNTDFCLKEKAR